MDRGTQVCYIPAHANGDLKHPDVEFGFVTSDAGERGVFCRYWRKMKYDPRNPAYLYLENVEDYLRTKSNSELTPRELLQEYHYIGQNFVDRALELYCQ
jgi:hypothetical protein